MNIVTSDLGFRELSRIADFIRKIENGNYNFNKLFDKYDNITIDYDLNFDEVQLLCTAHDENGTPSVRILHEDEEGNFITIWH